jgi:hypothetical protein
VKLRGIKSTSPRWIVVDEIGGPVTYHATQDEAHAVAKERGDGQQIVYVAQILLTNDSAQWARPIDARHPVGTKRKA